MMKRVLVFGLILSLLLCGCSNEVVEQNTYEQITQEVAKEMIDTQDVVILDVREQYEYDELHILDAVLLPLGNITEESAADVIPTKDSVVLVYCRSGNRSKQASDKLVALGYTQVFEFGGINTWQYEVE